jgi:hypothetical protein
MKSIFTVFSLVMALVFSAQAQGVEKAYTEACTCFKNLKGTKLTDDEKKAKGMECLQTVMMNNIEVIANESGFTIN